MSTRWAAVSMAIATIACACSRRRDPELRPEPDVGPAHPHDTASPPPSPSPSPADVPWIVDRDLKLGRHASVIMPNGMIVKDGAELSIEEGVTIAFGAGSALRVVDGTIVAHGSAADPVLFTSDATPKKDADWIGVVIEDQKRSGSILDHVVIEYAGKGPDAAALKVVGVAKLTLGSMTMQHDDGAGLSMVPLPPP